MMDGARHMRHGAGRRVMLGAALGLAACVSVGKPGAAVSLFDGTSLTGWTMVDGRPPDPRAWRAQDGLIAQVSRERPFGDLMTDRCYTDFDLSLEWRLEKGGNSGIIYRVAPRSDKPAWQSGIEFSLLDDANYPSAAGKPKQHSGAAFDLFAPAAHAELPAGQFNLARIRVVAGYAEQWLNGVEVVRFKIGAAGWRRALAASKFVGFPKFGEAECGHIVLQNHGDPVQFRNLRIVDLSR